LSTLANASLLLRAQTGNQVFYRANRDHPAYAELRDLLAKTTGVFHPLAEALTPLAKGIQFAFVYGSFAREEENAESDVDLMVVGSVTLDDVLERLAPVERALRRPANPTVYAPEELKAKLQADNHFLHAIQKGKNTFLLGDEHEFRQLR
jgi:predicted nucleotidyltransferase